MTADRHLRALAAAALIVLLGGLAACNTIEGAGEDIEAAGDAIEGTAEDTSDQPSE